MKNIKINWIKYHNFKGITDFTLDLNGNNAAVYAENAKGKTTLADGFSWLLFGKNTEEAAKFNVKPLDENGFEKIGSEPVVEAELMIENEKVLLKRELSEVWSKPNGQLEKERKPDKTKLYINQVPAKVGEFKKYIEDLIGESTFKLLTNPAAFNNIHWQDKRKILMDMIPSIDDASIINSNSSLKELITILENRSVEDQKKIIYEKKKQIKTDIELFSSRFDEAERAKPDVTDLNKAQIEADIEVSNIVINDFEGKLMDAKNSNGLVELRMQRSELDAKLSEEKNKFLSDQQISTAGLNEDVTLTQQKLNETNRQISNCEYSVRQLNQEIGFNKAEKTSLLDQYKKLQSDYEQKESESFEEHQLTCPTCDQELPMEQVEAIKTKFNTDKSEWLKSTKEKLEKILADGKSLATKIAESENEESNKVKEINELKKEAIKLQTQLDKLTEELNYQQSKSGTFEDSDQYKVLFEQIQKITQKMAASSSDNSEVVRNIQLQLDTAKEELSRLSNQLVLFKQVETQNNRIMELKKEEEQMKLVFMELEKQTYLIDEFTRIKVRLLEEEINKQFKMVNFKLFNIQKDGGLNETCEITVNGVPYSDLNNAGRINGGLDIINTLSSKHDVTAPIFIDNAESVNELIETQSQMISLIVSKDKKLKVEVI
ncbi:AAA family ATPase [Carnobacterium divergens]|uniref:AAA family ATPase n=1 Tax=Carnobacterium divergens TaxID=2748 RepID=UPI0039C98EFE